MVCGATSGAGKSTVTAALCRSWARSGRKVAPFKAQNMSNHSAVTPDGGEIGRAQAMQADAAGAQLDRRMNPILLKPTVNGQSHLVVLGQEVSSTDARGYQTTSEALRPMVLEAFTSLRGEYDWVVAEGAGGAAEINLLDRDLVNLPLAHATGMGAILVVDIDKGGAFAAAHGTIDLLPNSLKATVKGIIFNQFRGDATLLDDGIAQLERRSGVPVIGVLPHLGSHLMLGVEDSLDVQHGMNPPMRSPNPIRVGAIRLPHLANPSDLDPLMLEPDVDVQWVATPAGLDNVDLIVIPGSRATVADLCWLRTSGFAGAIGRSDSWVVGICAGYQMLGRRIDDQVESGAGTIDGLGLLDADTVFSEPKIVRQSHGTIGKHRVSGYQIRYGRPLTRCPGWLHLDGDDEGAISHDGTVHGTSLHGLFDADEFRTEFLAGLAETMHRQYSPAPETFSASLEAHHDHLADWIEAHIDIGRVTEMAASAPCPSQAPGWQQEN